MPDTRPRIAFLLPSLAGGGVERTSLLLAREFVRHGYAVEFALLAARGELLKEAEAEFDVVDLGVSRLRGALRPIASYLRRKRPTVTKAAMWPLTGIACTAARLAGSDTRVLVSEHIDFRQRRAPNRLDRFVLSSFGARMYSKAAGIVAVSEGVADSLVECAGVKRERITVIHNPIRMVRSLPEISEPCEDLSWWLEAPARLIAIGRLADQKAHDDLIAAMRTVLGAREARLLILGEGPKRGELEEQIAALGLSQHVRLPGFKARPDVYLDRASLFVMPSRYEGLGNVIIEALAMGVPVVATDCQSGPREILDGGRYGCLVPVGDRDALGAAILGSLAGSHDRNALQVRARDFSPEIAAKKYMDLFQI